MPAMPGALPSQKGLKECRQTARTVNSIPTLFRPQRVGLHRRGKNEVKGTTLIRLALKLVYHHPYSSFAMWCCMQKSRCRVVDCKAGLATIAPAPQLAPTFSEPSTSAGVVRSLCSDEFEADFPLAFELIQGPLVSPCLLTRLVGSTCLEIGWSTAATLVKRALHICHNCRCDGHLLVNHRRPLPSSCMASWATGRICSPLPVCLQR